MIQSLKEINDTNWKTLVRATVDQKHPFRYTVLSTVDEEQPNSRMVVLRDVNIPLPRLTFFTHYYSNKVQQIKENPKVSCLFWNGRQNIQLRLTGDVKIHYQDDVAENYWQTIPPYRQFEYTSPIKPGTPLSDTEDATLSNGQSRYFTILNFFPLRIDWLKLEREGHKRAIFIWNKEKWDGTWVAP